MVMVSPADSELIAGGSDERRRFMDVVISQYDKEYLDALIRYNKALTQRNTLLKSELPVEEELFLGLRKKSGISIQRFEDKFGLPLMEVYGQAIDDLEKDGLILVEKDCIRMSKKGLFLGDTVAEKFILEQK